MNSPVKFRVFGGRGVGWPLTLLVPFLLAVAGHASPLAAQERGAEERGWIGVGIHADHGCGAVAGEACGPAVVGSVILGGPAHRAGIQPGDTLLALGGREIRRGPADPVLRSIPLGEPVTVEVARAGERLELEVVPRGHPDSLAVVRLHGPMPRLPTGEETSPRPAPMAYGLAVPDALESLEGEALPGAPRIRIRAPDGRQFTVLRMFPTGRAGDLSRGLVHAEQEELREAMDRARLEMSRARDAVRSRREAMDRVAREMELRAARRAAEQWRSWIDDSLRSRLDAIHDSVLFTARRRLADVAEARTRVRVVPGPAAGSRDRIAGAELQGLTPELAEFFGGHEDGVLVLRVLAQTPAAELGLEPGDVIVRAAGQTVGSVEEFRTVLRAAGTAPVLVKWIRKGEEISGRLAR